MNLDKGNATVILDSNTYDKKMLDMLSDPEVNTDLYHQIPTQFRLYKKK